MTSNYTSEKHSFSAEIPELMNMIIHNFYSSKDIFIRELISNSSDALNKVKTFMYDNESIDRNLKISIRMNRDNRLLIIEDNGVGMTLEDLNSCLGTIARSGTKEFLRRLGNEKSTGSDLIGQFGVGFYSAFLVAEKVDVYTRHVSSDNVYLWESDAVSGYTVTQVDEQMSNGTRIVLHIREDSMDYVDESKITQIVKKHSGYISYPILLYKEKKPTVTKPVEQPTETQTSEEQAVDDQTETQTGEQQTGGEQAVDDQTDEVKVDDVQVDDVESDTEREINSSKQENSESIDEEPEYVELNHQHIWTRSPEDVTDEEYEQFYKSISNDWDSYQSKKHFKVEGDLEFKSILYIPKRAPFNMFNDEKPSSIKLYMKKVLISDKCKDLYPEYLHFVKGMIDVQELPLNASRELLQQSSLIKKLNKTLVKKTIEMFEDLATNEDDYAKFYENFGRYIKLGVHEDSNNRHKLLELLRFYSSKSLDKMISLKSYVERMPENQAGIYFITGNTLNNVKSSPFIDKLLKQDIEVLYMVEPIDEYNMTQVHEYSQKRFINAIKDDLKLEDSNETKTENSDEICKTIKEKLGDKVESVIVSKKLSSQPAVMSNKYGVSANMERIMKSQVVRDSNNMQNFGSNSKVLEINPEHQVIKNLVDKSYDENYLTLVYHLALIAGGYELENNNEFLSNVYQYI